MRFGLPEDFDVVVELPPVITKKIVTIAPQQSKLVQIGTKAKFSTASLDAYHRQLAELVGMERKCNSEGPVLSRFDDLRDAIDQIDHKANEYSTSVQYNENFKRYEATAKSNINRLILAEKQSLDLQNECVQRVIQREQERIRKEQELLRQQELERQERLLQEKKRKEAEEEARKKQLEEKKQEELRIQKEKEMLEKQRLEELAKEKEMEAKRKQELEEQKKQAELENAKQEELKAKQASSQTNFARIEKLFLKYKQDIVDIKQNVVQKLQESPEVKKHANQLKRKINPKFGQLSNSFSQLKKITDEVIQYIQMAQGNELAYKWIMNFVAKAIVDQAETEVIVKPTAALPLARLSYQLLLTFPEFEYYLTARFVKKCPYIIGYSCTIETEEGRLRMGYKRKDNQWEDSVKYDERVSGICTVWSVMTRLTEFPQHPKYSFEASWSFLARLLNTDKNLLTNTHFAVTANWWDGTANNFLPKYGKQSQKLLRSVIHDWPLSVSENKFPAAARLLILGEDWMNHNRIESLKEMEN
jgi:nucleoporin GLE1